MAAHLKSLDFLAPSEFLIGTTVAEIVSRSSGITAVEVPRWVIFRGCPSRRHWSRCESSCADEVPSDLFVRGVSKPSMPKIWPVHYALGVAGVAVIRNWMIGDETARASAEELRTLAIETYARLGPGEPSAWHALSKRPNRVTNVR